MYQNRSEFNRNYEPQSNLALNIIIFVIVCIIAYIGWSYYTASRAEAVYTPPYDTYPYSVNPYSTDQYSAPADSVDVTSEVASIDPTWERIDAVGGSGGGPFEFKCPEGSGVSEYLVYADEGVNAIKVKCNSNPPIYSDKYGGDGGMEHVFGIIPGVAGNESINITGHSFVGNITPGDFYVSSGGMRNNAGGRAEGELFSGDDHLLTCNPGYQVAGIHGGSGDLVDSLGLWCAKI